jgi:hypothetical protein
MRPPFRNPTEGLPRVWQTLLAVSTPAPDLRRELASFGAGELASFGAFPIFPMASFGATADSVRSALASRVLVNLFS